jgi:hypothetical protein
LIIGSFAMVAVLFTLWIKLFERRSMASVGLVLSRQSIKTFAGGYGNGLLMGTAVVCGVLLLGGYGLEADTGDRSLDLVPIVILMFAFILQSGTEEMVFRGWMMGRIADALRYMGGHCREFNAVYTDARRVRQFRKYASGHDCSFHFNDVSFFDFSESPCDSPKIDIRCKRLACFMELDFHYLVWSANHRYRPGAISLDSGPHPDRG